MKILLAAGLFPPDIGGPSRYAKMVADGLGEHDIEVSVLAFSSVRHLPKIVRHLVYIFFLIKMSLNADAIYALDSMSVGFPARIASILTGRKLLIRLGGDYVWEQGVQRWGIAETLDEYTRNIKAQKLIVRLAALVQTWVVKGAETIILPSFYLQSIVEQWGIPTSQTKVIYSAHSVPQIDYSRTQVRAARGFTGFTIVTICRLTPWKGVKTLIDLVKKRVSEGKETSLIIGGDGPQRQELEQYVKANNLDSHVRFLGVLSFDEVFKIVLAADVFVLDTTYEGLSHQLIEVMAIGTPIVTTDIPGNRELITNNLDGILVTPRDVFAYDQALDFLISNPAAKNELIKNAQLRASSFASYNAVGELAQHLKSFVS